MINTVKSSTLLGDPRDDQRSPRKPPEGEADAAPAAKSPNPEQDVRLVIEEDRARSVLIYKLIDRATGEVISEVSRDDLMKMGADPLYTAGRVINTKA